MKSPTTRTRIAVSTATAAAASLAPATVAAPIVITPPSPISVEVPAFHASGLVGDSAPLDLNIDGVADFTLEIRHLFYHLSITASLTQDHFSGRASLIPAPGNGVHANSAFHGRNPNGLSLTVGPGFNSGTGPLRRRHSHSSNGVPNGNGSRSGEWYGGQNFGDTVGYAAVRFYDNNFDVHFGWIKLSVKTDALGVPIGVQALQWAYETVADAPFHVTEVPEVPAGAAGLGALALGAAGIQALRRKRRGKTVANPPSGPKS